MLSILCPHCQAQLGVEEHRRGTTVRCPSCGQQLAITAGESALEEPADFPSVVVGSRPRTTSRRRQKAVGNRVINTLLHLSITAATVFTGYYLITQRRPDVGPKPLAVAEPPPQANTTPSKESPSRPARRQTPRTVPRETELPTAPLLELPEPTVSPFEDGPSTVNLPLSNDVTIVTLTKDLQASDRVQFVSATSAIEHQGNKLVWNDNGSDEPKTVADLSVSAGDLVFRWLAPIPQKAESAIRNSIVRVESGEFQHAFALRHPETSQPLKIDLNKPLQRIDSKCEFLPAVEQVYFALSGIGELPVASREGADPARMQIRDQTTLTYTDAPGAATRLTVKKRGNLVAVELESRYVLPSGEKQSMTIERGNKRLNELVALHQEAQEAAKRLKTLRSQLGSLQSDARTVPRSRAAPSVKSMRLRELQNSILVTQRQIQYAEHLLKQQDAIAADHQAIQQIAKLAQQLHETKLAYRFYTVVDGHEVDVLIAP